MTTATEACEDVANTAAATETAPPTNAMTTNESSSQSDRDDDTALSRRQKQDYYYDKSLWFFTRPCREMNYNVVCLVYAVGCCIAMILYLIDCLSSKQGDATQVDKEENDINHMYYTLQELMHVLEGSYVIFTPFFPCLVWSLLVRRNWQKANQQSSKEKQS